MGEIWEFDYRRGILVRHFFLGDKAVKGDFEGIAIAGTTREFMLTSSGKLLSVPRRRQRDAIAYSMGGNGVEKWNGVRGYAFDPAINSLLSRVQAHS